MDVGVYFSHKAVGLRGIVREALEAVHDNVSVGLGGELALPDEALDVIRSQYNTRELIKYLTGKKQPPSLWVVEADLFSPGTNHVFGEALARQAGVLSKKRLSSDELVAKEAVHEFGHVLGLRHCKNQCVMEYSANIRDLSDKPKDFCASCRSVIDTLLEESHGEGLSK